MFAVSFRSALMAAIQSGVIAAPLNGWMPLVQVARLAPKKPPAALPCASNPAPKFGWVMTARRRSSEATPVVRKLLFDAPFDTGASHVQSITGRRPSKPARRLYVVTSVMTSRLPRPGTKPVGDQPASGLVRASSRATRLDGNQSESFA